jgi:hypothetical protein
LSFGFIMQTGPPRETHRPLALGGGLARALYGSVDRAAASSTSPLGFFVDGGESVENLQQLGWLPVLDSPMWHTTSLLSEGSAAGDVLHSFFGYSDAPTPLQLVIYLAYLAVVVVTYLGLRSRAVAWSHGGAAGR